jgi:hypothetical protein
MFAFFQKLKSLFKRNFRDEAISRYFRLRDISIDIHHDFVNGLPLSALIRDASFTHGYSQKEIALAYLEYTGLDLTHA